MLKFLNREIKKKRKKLNGNQPENLNGGHE